MPTNDDIVEVFNGVAEQLEAAMQNRQPIQSAHEGYAVIKEELDELWDAVKKDDLESAELEARHVAAMAIRFLLDLYVRPSKGQGCPKQTSQP